MEDALEIFQDVIDGHYGEDDDDVFSLNGAVSAEIFNGVLTFIKEAGDEEDLDGYAVEHDFGEFPQLTYKMGEEYLSLYKDGRIIRICI